MSLLSELNTLLKPLIPIETGVFSDAPPNRYLVITPLSDTFELYADNMPNHEMCRLWWVLRSKGLALYRPIPQNDLAVQQQV